MGDNNVEQIGSCPPRVFNLLRSKSPSTCPSVARFVALPSRGAVGFFSHCILSMASPFPQGRHLVSHLWVGHNEIQKSSEVWGVHVVWQGRTREPSIPGALREVCGGRRNQPRKLQPGAFLCPPRAAGGERLFQSLSQRWGVTL